MVNLAINTTKSLNDFSISECWPASKPGILQLYSMPTPNGQKVSIMLEETGIEYETHKIPLNEKGVKSPQFLSLNPNNKIPAIIDPQGPDGKPIGLFESGAILIYLAEKSKQFYGQNETERFEVMQWLMFQMAGLGPMGGQFGFFHFFEGKDYEDKRPLARYTNEIKRILNVIDQRLEDRDWLATHYSIADMATAPWLNCIEQFYKASDVVGLRDFKNVSAYMERFNARPAVKAGLNVPEHNWN